MRRRTDEGERPPHRLDSALATALAVLLVWAPLPLGSNRPWSWALLSVALAALLVVWAIGSMTRGKRPQLGVAFWLAGACTLAVWTWAWLQTVPLAILSWLPAGWAHPAWADAAEAGIAVQPLIGLDGDAGREALMRLMTYAAAFFLGAVLGSHAALARRLLIAVVIAAVLQAGWAFVSQAFGIGHIWWNQPRVNLSVLSGTFINRNHFATLVNLGAVVALGLALTPLVERTRAGEDEIVSRLTRVVEQHWPFLVAAVLLISASLASGSRGGAFSLALALVALAALLARRLRPGRAAILVSLVLFVGLGWGAVQGLGGRVVVERMVAVDQSEDMGSGGRLAAWEASLRLVAERPWLGHGLGGYRAAFERIRDERFPKVFREAHNVYLEHAVELGLPATALLYLGVLLPVAVCAGQPAGARRSRLLVPAIGLTATILVAVHSLVEFSLQIPAVAVAYATILGIAYAAIRSHRRSRSTLVDSKPASS